MRQPNQAKASQEDLNLTFIGAFPFPATRCHWVKDILQELDLFVIQHFQRLVLNLEDVEVVKMAQNGQKNVI